VVESFGDGFILNIDMRYGSSNVALDANICDDKHMGGITQRLNSHIIKLMNS